MVYFFAAMTVLCLAIAALAGWIMNIVALFHGLADPVTGLTIIRAVGVFFAPLGVILGYL